MGLPRASVLERFSSKDGLAADRAEAASLGGAMSEYIGCPRRARVPDIRIRTEAPSASHGEHKLVAQRSRLPSRSDPHCRTSRSAPDVLHACPACKCIGPSRSMAPGGSSAFFALPGLVMMPLREAGLCADEAVAGSASSLSSTTTAPQSPTTPRQGPFEVLAYHQHPSQGLTRPSLDSLSILMHHHMWIHDHLLHIPHFMCTCSPSCLAGAL